MFVNFGVQRYYIFLIYANKSHKMCENKKYLQKNLHNSIICCNFVADLEKSLGEMLEWLKRHAWKACKLQKGFRGSNPRLSAKK